MYVYFITVCFYKCLSICLYYNCHVKITFEWGKSWICIKQTLMWLNSDQTNLVELTNVWVTKIWVIQIQLTNTTLWPLSEYWKIADNIYHHVCKLDIYLTRWMWCYVNCMYCVVVASLCLYGFITGSDKSQGLILVELEHRFPDSSPSTLLWIFSLRAITSSCSGRKRCTF